jgi:hypothetical protein
VQELCSDVTAPLIHEQLLLLLFSLVFGSRGPRGHGAWARAQVEAPGRVSFDYGVVVACPVVT